MPSRSICQSLKKGTFSEGMPGMPLKPPSFAEPMWNSGPAVELIELKRIRVTVSVMTPR